MNDFYDFFLGQGGALAVSGAWIFFLQRQVSALQARLSGLGDRPVETVRPALEALREASERARAVASALEVLALIREQQRAMPFLRSRR